MTPPRHDQPKPVAASWRARIVNAPRAVLLALVRAYRLLLSPWLGSACRFAPTCSGYALVALENHGALAGSVLTVHRLARCHPWCEGGADPVPAHPPRWFSRLIADDDSPSATLPISSPSREKTFP